MTLEIEHRPSASPYVERVWRSRSDDVARMTAVATPRWSLVFWKQSGRTYGAVQGPGSKASHAPVPEDATFFGIDFAVGTTMPHLPVGRLVDGHADIPDATGTSVWLAGSAWHLPDYDNAETFVRRLVREGVVVRDPLVADVVRGAEPDASARTVQRRFVAATGLTRGAVRQIDRARQAAVLLRQGLPTAEVVNRLGYFDQPHLAHSLSRYIGRTATSLRDGGGGEPLSLLYKT
ncbi:helix-turn-helix protein [Pseudonocardia hierapolitana]|uniref:Helix-turn-helix protein n=1 Tax=Pseudonocardia hierapolitana TaxID=1128676 RepID=A0A561SVL6_9PSEU|nr:helix-turn-helix domain-containing protein [Pseudonocardia hierapolitana]TWF78895.1 helix-turn-helix protein [Pseudonocardia hierapolitana]